MALNPNCDISSSARWRGLACKCLLDVENLGCTKAVWIIAGAGRSTFGASHLCFRVPFWWLHSHKPFTMGKAFTTPLYNSRGPPRKKLCPCATDVVNVSSHHVCRCHCQLTYFISIAYAAASSSPNNSQSRIHLVITQEALLTRRTAAVTDVPFVAP